MTERYHGFDALRATALLLGVVLHSAGDYRIPWREGWSITATTIIYVIHIFRMPVFFLMAGFFGRMLLERRGPDAFIWNRLRRILLPLVVAWLLIDPHLGDRFRLGHLWFLYQLLLFYAAALLLRRLNFKLPNLWPLWPIPFAVAMYLSGSRTGIPMPDTSLIPEPLPFIGYGSFFLAGWLLQGPIRYWQWPLAAALPLSIATAFGYYYDIDRAVLCLVFSLSAWLWVAGLTGAAMALFNRPRPAWRYVADASYWIYLVHVPLVFWLVPKVVALQWPWPVQWLSVIAIALPPLFASYHWLGRRVL